MEVNKGATKNFYPVLYKETEINCYSSFCRCSSKQKIIGVALRVNAVKYDATSKQLGLLSRDIGLALHAWHMQG